MILTKKLKKTAEKYNTLEYFRNDPILFPRYFYSIYCGISPTLRTEVFPRKQPSGIVLQDIEIAGIIAAHLAWGRRTMIIRDTVRAMEEMEWQPYVYIIGGNYREEDTSLHRTVKWKDFARICRNLKDYYAEHETLENLTPDGIRTRIYGQKSNPGGANKKIHMFRRWMVRNDGKVDLGIWKHTSPGDLIIPLDVHVHRSALELGITRRKSADGRTAREITDYLQKVFPGDPCKGDFALFAYSASKNEKEKTEK